MIATPHKASHFLRCRAYVDKPFPRGFSLIEVVVVLAILALLATLIMAGVQRAREAAARAACASNMRQISLAVHMFAETHHHFPKGCNEAYSRTLNSTTSPLGLSWHTSILPYVEQAPLWSQVEAAHRHDPRGHSAAHGTVLRTVVPVFLCPTDGRRTITDGLGQAFGLTAYRGVAGTGHRFDDGIFHNDLVVRPTDVTDGLSNTLMIGERPTAGPEGMSGSWYAVWGYQVCPLTHILGAGARAWIPTEAVGCPLSIPAFAPGRPDSLCSVGHFWSLHTSGGNFAFADGSVKFMRYSSESVLPALATRSGGEPVPAE